MNVRKATLGELIETQKGFAFKSAWFSEEGRPIVKVKDFTTNSIDTSNLSHISEDEAENHLRYELSTGDVVIQTVGSWPSNPASVVGKCVKIPRHASGALLNQNAVKISPSERIDNRYLYYAVKAPAFGEYIVGTAQGAASQAAITLDSIRAYKLDVPPLTVQHKIAGILSAYDDLIENNLRRIKILEDMAQSLYREWFVHFRFPGHESTKMIDSPLGPIPEDWEVKKVEEVFDIVGGGTPSKKMAEYWIDGNIQWYSPRDLTAENTMFMENSANQINELGLKKSSAKLVPANSVMLTSRATIGAIAINTTPACTNQGFITCLPNSRTPVNFLYQWLNANVDMFISHSSGATFKEISKGVFRQLNFLLPSQQQVNQYENLIKPISKQLLNLQRRNTNLRQTRDLLLPKLLTPDS